MGTKAPQPCPDPSSRPQPSPPPPPKRQFCHAEDKLRWAVDNLHAAIEDETTADSLRAILREAADEIKRLRDYKIDIEESTAITMDEKCTADEKHCTCVPLLRAEIERLRDANSILLESERELNDEVDRLRETLEIVSDPKNMAMLHRGLADVEAGRLVDGPDIDADDEQEDSALPKAWDTTADGVRVTEGDTVWAVVKDLGNRMKGGTVFLADDEYLMADFVGDHDTVSCWQLMVGDCYSTREAAEAAKLEAEDC